MIRIVLIYSIRAVLTIADTSCIEFPMQSFSDVIAAFGGVVPFRDALGLPDVNARQMKQRDSIPPGYWPRIVEVARERELDGVTLEVLADLAKAKLDETVRAKLEAAQ